MSWWVYMVETASGKLYTGISTDVERRFQEHQSGKNGARFFRSDAATAIRYREACSDRSEASKREYAIKQLTRQQKWQLIEQYIAQPEAKPC